MRSILLAAGLAAVAAMAGARVATATEYTDQPALRVIVLDEDGEPVPNVAVVVHAGDSRPEVRSAKAAQSAQTAKPAQMHQQNQEFAPHILIIEQGTVVEFPNHDELLHHVYSFSEAKRFEIPLYGGAISPKLEFDRAGLVTLGCNIHDGMLGYILVVDTPHYAKTDASGEVLLTDLPPGRWTVETWTPRLRPDRLPEPITYASDGADGSPLVVRFESKLRPPHAHSESSLTWDPY